MTPGSGRSYKVLLAEDGTALNAKTVQAAFDVDYEERTKRDPRADRFEVFAGAQIADYRDVIRLASHQPSKVDLVLLDNYLSSPDHDEPVPAALAAMNAITTRCDEQSIEVPLVALHTGGIDPRTAWTFRCAGGARVIDKQRVPDLADRVKRLWRMLDGERWAPQPQPPAVHIEPAARLSLPYLEESWLSNEEIAAALGRKPGALSNAIGAARGALLPHVEGRLTVGDRPRIVAAAIRAGYVWVPLRHRQQLFKARPAPPRLAFDPEGTVPSGDLSRRRAVD